ncbi:unnamed protein product [Cuscuta epithymum]|uniref:Cyclin-dependent kinase inhibitor n=1 Tax=Cuscuta epithymum TaxID=186058 RepID=A0AAV0F1V5_9ASTE|nr:unnamed protein product [Cuscuta epithymum]
MGKYMREAKIAGDVAVMELSQTTIGVRTRARTLELQRRQSAALPPNPDSGYLQLRSRRLEKPSALPANSKKPPKRNQNSGSKTVNSAQDHNSDANSSSRVRVNSGSVKCDSCDLSLGTTSYGIDIVGSEQRDRETTPCSFASEEEDVNALGPVTGWANMSYLPSIGEMDEFFIHSEQQQQALFVDKYNFDIANDMPLPGRYDWVRVSQ